MSLPCSIRSRTSSVLSRQAKLAPCLSLSNAGVDNFFMCGKSYPACSLNLLAFIVKSPCYDRLGTILICCGSLGRKGINLIVEILVVGPVLLLLAAKLSEATRKHCGRTGAYFTALDIFKVRKEALCCIYFAHFIRYAYYLIIQEPVSGLSCDSGGENK
jgi:hypothetical protein